MTNKNLGSYDAPPQSGEPRANLKGAAADLYEVVRRLDYFRAALIAREYEPGSPAVVELLDQAARALAKAQGKTL